MKNATLHQALFRLFFLFLVFMANSSCKQKPPVMNPINTTHMTAQLWNILEGKRIFFGHQSVGYNLVRGIERRVGRDSIPYKIIDSKKPADFNGAAFYHAPVGKNVEPKTKIDEFVALMDGGMAQKVDVAGFKFCYADIRVETDIQELLNYYTSKMDYLVAKYPRVKFFHFTVPLTVKPRGLKGLIKKLAYDHNINREKLGKLIETHYQPDHVFDLARFEAQFPDGRINTYGKNRLALIDDFSDDGEHLNAVASDNISEQLLIFLAKLASK